MKVRSRFPQSKVMKEAGVEFEVTSEWKDIPTIELYKVLKKFPSMFDVVCNYNIKPFEKLSKWLKFEGPLVFTSDPPAQRALEKMPFVKHQATRQGLRIYRIVNHEEQRLADYAQLSRTVNALVFRELGGIGDIIMTTPVIEEVHNRYPNCKITYACPSKFIDLIKGNPFVNNIVILNTELTKQTWDVVVDLTRDCIKYEISQQPDVEFNRAEIFFQKCGLGMGKIPRPKVFLDEDEILAVKKELPKDRLKIGLVLESNARVRNWPYMQEFREELSKRYPESLILEFCHKKPDWWKGFDNSFPVFDRSLREVMTLLNECDVVIAPDTGLAHISSALSVPTIWIFTHIDGSIRTRNYQNVYLADVSYEDCPIGKPCFYKITCGKGRGENTESPSCALSITPDKVFEKLEEVLSRPNVSYVVVYYNKSVMTENCIDRIFSYKKFNDEVILFDNGSSEKINTAGFKGLKIITNKTNEGCIVGRNKAFKQANGRYIFSLDNDQFISAHSFHKLSTVEADIAGVEAWSMDDKGFAHGIVQNQGDLAYVGAGGMLTKREVIEDLNGFDEIYKPAWFEDPDFCFRAKEKGYTIGFPLFHGIQHLSHQTVYSQKTFISQEAWERSYDKFVGRWIYSGRRTKAEKIKIALLADVIGWAWDFKARQLAKYLSDEFKIEIIYVTMTRSGLYRTDVLFTFDCERRFMQSARFTKYITGATAHTYSSFADWKRTLSEADAIHANSMILFNELKNLNPKCFYVPNGVDLELFPYHKRDIRKPFTVGYVGKNIFRKGFNDFVVPACEKAKVNFKALTSKYNSPEKTPYEKMHEFYRDIDAILIASDMDGTPNQLLEAAAVGRTFIGNKIGNVPEFVKQWENGVMVDRKVDAYVEAILKLKEDRTLCRDMGDAARQTVVEGWTWEKMSENYRNLFRSIM